ncbi:MAG: hypothetical protein R2793_05965 [Flavobacteriaceae bacterium]
MSKFAVERIKEVSINFNVYKLIINKKSHFDNFFNEFKDDKNYNIELGQIQSILSFIGSGEEDKIPYNKYKPLKRNKKDPYIDYEIKTSNLRVYLFKDAALGKIIVLGGKKKSQTKDIEKFRKIKADYFNSK